MYPAFVYTQGPAATGSSGQDGIEPARWQADTQPCVEDEEDSHTEYQPEYGIQDVLPAPHPVRGDKEHDCGGEGESGRQFKS